MYSAKIYYTRNFHTSTETVDNIIRWEADEDGNVTIVFGDPETPTMIERHLDDIEDVNIFRVNPAFM